MPNPIRHFSFDSLLRNSSFVIGLILLLALALRLWGIHFGLPYLYHADEPIIVNHSLAYGTRDFNPHFFRVPPLASYLLFTVYGLYFIAGKVFGFFPSILQYEYFFYDHPAPFYLLGRFFLGVIPGTLTVYLIYQTVRKHFSEKKALVSALLMAVCFLHVRDSHYIYCDMFLLLALAFAWSRLWQIVDQPQKLSLHFMFGASAGICCAFKYNGGAIILPYLLISIPLTKAYSKILRNWSLMFFGLVLFYFVLNPFSLLDFRFFMREVYQESLAHQGGTPWAHHYFYSLQEGLGTPLWILATGAWLFSFFKKNLKVLSLAFFTLAYYIILIRGGQSFERYVLPLLPSLLILTADGLVDFCAKFRKPVFSLLFIVSLSAMSNLVQCVRFDKIMSSTDTRTQAADWIKKNIPVGASVAISQNFFGPRLYHSPSQLKKKIADIQKSDGESSPRLRKLKYYLGELEKNNTPYYELYFLTSHPEQDEKFSFSGPFMPFSITALHEHQIQYVVMINLYPAGANPPQTFYDQFVKQASLVAEFSPYQKSSILAPVDPHILTGGPFSWGDLQRRERNGYSLKIYRLTNM
ncbi:MAG: phospholipid carrier-dependent glycosyltransferase [Candidatus Omnitrophica bacterium]|nr:phospholipid carrier-dependent glycosyltransferase [Candidatus Omnitrophota bacterium]